MEFAVNGLCGLCGNAGVVDARGQRGPAGQPCGALHYCVCPNGRTLKAHGAPKAEWLALNNRDAQHRRAWEEGFLRNLRERVYCRTDAEMDVVLRVVDIARELLGGAPR
jgi:hypothetical protein